MTNNLNYNNSNDINRLFSIEICIQAQELVQELLNKFTEINSVVKSSFQGITTSDPNFNRFRKIDETISHIDSILNKLKSYCRIINQRKIDRSDNFTITDLQPLQTAEVYNQNKLYLEERILEKNSYIKILIDHLLNIIWQINSLKSLE